MKEYIYFDRQLVNSTLAQIDEGILTKLISGQTTTDTSQEDGGEEITYATNGGLNIAVASAKSEFSKKEIDKFSSVYSKGNSELIETALDDYSVDVLIDKLTSLGLLKESSEDLADGETFVSTDNFDVFNFEQLKVSVEKENLENVLKTPIEIDEARVELEKLTKSPHLRVKNKNRIQYLESYLKTNDPYANFQSALQFANYSSVLFPDTTLFRIGSFLAFCGSENLRINLPLMTFLSQTKRKITILGIVTTKRDKELVPGEGVQLPSDTIISSAPAIISDILLDKFMLAPIGSYFVRPIAIYFEN
ncbi:DUF6414 family protein [Enterococcus mundtii]|uniref:Uncharacterized protein n=1 Tax=Enterococcus mundtii TaxID=53346 RepID=A0A242L0X3_ENTMU|nr:hypothetical protein [Enterococcus mundtii]OTP27771.1 hypothetical protein A5802_001507 [Enterococcus mundtii]